MITFSLGDAVEGCRHVQRRLAEIANVMDHAGDLMEHWERLVVEGNLRGVLAGTDRDGNPMLPVTYRPKNAKPLTVAQRLGQDRRAKRGEYFGRGLAVSGVQQQPHIGRVSAARRSAPGSARTVLPRDHEFRYHVLAGGC